MVVRTPAGLRLEGRCPHQGALLGGRARRRSELIVKTITGALASTCRKCEGGLQCLVSSSWTKRAVLVDIFWAFARPGSNRGNAHVGRYCRSEELHFGQYSPQLDLAKVRLNLERWAAQYGAVYTVPKWAHSVSWCFQTQSGVNRSCSGTECFTVNPKLMGINSIFSQSVANAARIRHVLRWPSITCGKSVSKAADRHHPPEKNAGNGWRNRAALDIVEELKRSGRCYDAHHLRLRRRHRRAGERRHSAQARTRVSAL